MKKSKILAAVAAAAVSVSAAAVSAGAYNAYIAIQTQTYSFRNEWNHAQYGKDSPWFNNWIVWGAAATDPETFPEYEDKYDYDLKGYALDATYTDAVIDADGTFTVKAEGIDWDLKDENDYNLLFVSTDIPMDAGVTCTSATIIVDGKEIETVENPISDETQDYFNIMLKNIYNSDDSVKNRSVPFPTSDIAIKFTLAGLGSGAADAATETAATAGDTTAATDSTKAGSPDTGVEDVAVVAGLAVAAGAGIVLTRKRK